LHHWFNSPKLGKQQTWELDEAVISGVIGPGRIAEAQEEASQQAAALQPVCQTLEPRSHQLSDGLNMVKHGLSEAKKTGQIT